MYTFSELMNSGKFENAAVFCDTIVVSKAFLTSLSDLFKPEITTKAGKFVDSGEYAILLKKQRPNEKLDMSDMYDDKQDKKEDRRNKAAQGKAGGGAQGRETKTKGNKNKKKQNRKHHNDDSDQEFEEGNKKSTALEFMTSTELNDKISSVNTLRDAPEELTEELSNYFKPNLNRQYEEAVVTLYQSKLTASMASKRQNFQEFQDKINTLVENIKLFEKGIQCFGNQDDKDKFEKYLLKTLGHELMNESVLYACQEHQVSNDKQDLNVDQRKKIIAQLPKDIAQHLNTLNKSLDNVSDFVNALDDHLTSAVDVTFKKSDRKKDRQIVFGHRQNLMSQLENCQDPALSLHLVSLILFQCQTGCMLHASGKFVPNILSKVSENLDEDSKNLLSKYQNLVVSLINCKDAEEKNSIQRQLEESLGAIKDVALNAKKVSPS